MPRPSREHALKLNGWAVETRTPRKPPTNFETRSTYKSIMLPRRALLALCAAAAAAAADAFAPAPAARIAPARGPAGLCGRTPRSSTGPRPPRSRACGRGGARATRSADRPSRGRARARRDAHMHVPCSAVGIDEGGGPVADAGARQAHAPGARARGARFRPAGGGAAARDVCIARA